MKRCRSGKRVSRTQGQIFFLSRMISSIQNFRCVKEIIWRERKRFLSLRGVMLLRPRGGLLRRPQGGGYYCLLYKEGEPYFSYQHFLPIKSLYFFYYFIPGKLISGCRIPDYTVHNRLQYVIVYLLGHIYGALLSSYTKITQNMATKFAPKASGDISSVSPFNCFRY